MVAVYRPHYGFAFLSAFVLRFISSQFIPPHFSIVSVNDDLFTNM